MSQTLAPSAQHRPLPLNSSFGCGLLFSPAVAFLSFGTTSNYSLLTSAVCRKKLQLGMNLFVSRLSLVGNAQQQPTSKFIYQLVIAGMCTSPTLEDNQYCNYTATNTMSLQSAIIIVVILVLFDFLRSFPARLCRSSFLHISCFVLWFR